MKVIIVGGGIMGLSIAHELRQDRLTAVVVLEKSIPGAEASSAAAGMLAPHFECDTPGPMMNLCMLSGAHWNGFARSLEDFARVPVHYVRSGGLQVAFTEDEAAALRQKLDRHGAANLRGEYVTGAALRELEPELSNAALAAAYFPDDHQVQPRALLNALAVAASKAGVIFKTGTVRGLVERNGKARGVDVGGERIEGDVVILAAGAWSALLAGAGIDDARIKPVRGQMLELKLRAPRFTRMLKSPRGYVVPRNDGTVVAGSTMEFVGFDKQVTAEGLLKLLHASVELVPSLGGAPVTATWAGLRPWTGDQLPFIGEGPLPGLLLATGHFRNGILLAPITTHLIGQLVRGQPPSIDLRPFRYQREVV